MKKVVGVVIGSLLISTVGFSGVSNAVSSHHWKHGKVIHRPIPKKHGKWNGCWIIPRNDGKCFWVPKMPDETW